MEKDGPSSHLQIFMKCQRTYLALSVPWGDLSDQDRSVLCPHTLYKYETLCAMAGKDVMRAYRKGRILLEEWEWLSWGKDETLTRRDI